MIKRRSLVQAAAALPFAAPLAADSVSEPKQSQPPRVLFFLLADDMRFDAYSAAGFHRLETPHIDWLARNGSEFKNHFVTTSICPTSRASILTGQYARRHGIWNFSTKLSPEQTQASLPALLKQAGYQTGFFGKWGIGSSPPEGLFDHWQGYTGQGQYETESGLHLTDKISQQVQSWLAQVANSDRIALFVNTKAPHVQDEIPNGFINADRFDRLYANQTFQSRPNVSPTSFAKLPEFLQDSEGRLRWSNRFSSEKTLQETTRKYHRLIAGVDDLLGNTLKTLEASFGLNETITVFSSDNGFFLGEHGLAGKWWGFEEAIRTPLIIQAPGLNQSKPITQISLNIDIAPTILDLLNIKSAARDRMQGLSLVPTLLGKHLPRNEFFYEHLFAHPKIPKTLGIRTLQHKYLVYPDRDNAEMMFDLEQDPFELSNIASDPAQKNLAAAFRERTHRYMESLS